MYTCHMLLKQRKSISKFIVFKIVKVPHHNRQGLSMILRLTSMLKVIVRKVTITGRRGLCDVEGSWGVWTARWRQSSDPITAPGSPGGGCLGGGGGGGGDDWQAIAIPTKCELAFGRKNSGEHNKAQGNAGVGAPNQLWNGKSGDAPCNCMVAFNSGSCAAWTSRGLTNSPPSEIPAWGQTWFHQLVM